MNPRNLSVQTLSKRPPSTTRPLLRVTAGIIPQFFKFARLEELLFGGEGGI